MTQQNQSKPRLVILEDKQMLRDLLASYVTGTSGFEVVGSADDGRSGFELCEREQPDVVLFEMFLPGLNGIEVLRQFGPKNPDTRFIAISSQFTPDSVRELLELGCHGIVTTASPAERLQEGLKEVAKGGGYLCPICASLLRESHLIGNSASKRKSRLSNREREVLQAVAEGFSTKQIAEMLTVSVKTIEAHRANLMKKLDARSAVELTRCAFELGIIEVPGQSEAKPFTEPTAATTII